MQANWWQSFFDDKIGDFMFGRISPQRTKLEVREIVSRAKFKHEKKLLDLACGQGRHSLEFARKSFDVTGLDFSKDYLKIAQNKARKINTKSSLRFTHGDMRLLQKYFQPNEFDYVVSLYNSFGYFDQRSDDRSVLNGVHSILKPGGLFVLNTLNLEGVAYRLNVVPSKTKLKHLDRWEQLSSKSYLLDRASFDSSAKTIRVEWRFLDIAKSKVDEYSFRQNVYSHSELKQLLKKSGFKFIKVWGQLDGEKFSKYSWHQTILAKKE